MMHTVCVHVVNRVHKFLPAQFHLIIKKAVYFGTSFLATGWYILMTYLFLDQHASGIWRNQKKGFRLQFLIAVLQIPWFSEPRFSFVYVKRVADGDVFNPEKLKHKKDQ